MTVQLNQGIELLDNSAIVNSKASETYVSVRFTYDTQTWEGYVPIEYRRTGTDISFDDKDKLHEYLNKVYDDMNPKNLDAWREEQSAFWETKPYAKR